MKRTDAEKIEELEGRIFDVIERVFAEYMKQEENTPCPTVLVKLLTEGHKCVLSRMKTLVAGVDGSESPEELLLKLDRARETVQMAIRQRAEMQ